MKRVLKKNVKPEDVRAVEEEKEMPKRANLPKYGGKKTITRNVFRKTMSDREADEKLKKDWDAAYDRLDKEGR